MSQGLEESLKSLPGWQWAAQLPPTKGLQACEPEPGPGPSRGVEVAPDQVGDTSPRPPAHTGPSWPPDAGNICLSWLWTG